MLLSYATPTLSFLLAVQFIDYCALLPAVSIVQHVQERKVRQAARILRKRQALQGNSSMIVHIIAYHVTASDYAHSS